MIPGSRVTPVKLLVYFFPDLPSCIHVFLLFHETEAAQCSMRTGTVDISPHCQIDPSVPLSELCWKDYIQLFRDGWLEGWRSGVTLTRVLS